MKKITSYGIAVTLAAGALSLGIVAPASAAESELICSPGIPRAGGTLHPAVGEPTLTVANPDYVAPVDAVPGTPAVGTPKIVVDNPDYIPATPGSDAIPAVGEPTIEVPNPDYVEAVPGTDAIPAVGEPTITITNPDYVPAVPAVPGADAIGTPTIEVEEENPDYVAAVAEVPEISHTDYHAKQWVVDVPASDAVYEDRITEREFKKLKHKGHGWEYKWFPVNRHVGDKGWEPTGNVKTEVVKVKDAVAEQGHWDYRWFHEHPGNGWHVKEEEKHITQHYVPGSEAVGTPTIIVTKANPDYVAATPGTPGVDAIGEPTITVENPDYVAEVPATEGTPAQGEPTLTIPNPDYVEAIDAVPGTDAVGEPVLVIDNPDYVAAKPGTDAVPAVGEPTIVIDNPDFEASWIEIILIPTTVCLPVTPDDTKPDVTPEVPEDVKPGDDGDKPAGDNPEVVKPAAKPATGKTAVAAEKDQLAATGMESIVPLTGGALAVAMLGLGGVLFAKRRHTAQQD